MGTQHLVFYHNHKHIRKSNPRNSVRGLQGLYLSVIWWTRPNLFQQSLRASDSRFDMFAILSAWLRVLVPPQRPSGYESDELTVCSNPQLLPFKLSEDCTVSPSKGNAKVRTIFILTKFFLIISRKSLKSTLKTFARLTNKVSKMALIFTFSDGI